MRKTGGVPGCVLLAPAPLAGGIRMLGAFEPVEIGFAAPERVFHSPDDQAVRPVDTERIAAALGGGAVPKPQHLPPGNDLFAHTLTGDTLSPDPTGPLVQQILDRAATL